ncbi:MAG: hypothetical protein AAGJ83_00435 [Planctomycetota bacterium]
MLPRLFLLLLGFCVGLPATTRAQLPVIQLHSLSRSAFQPGDTAEVQITGIFIDEVQELRFSHPGISAELLTHPPRPFSEKSVPREGFFRLRIASDVPAGSYEVRAIGRFGVSNPRSILVHRQLQFIATAGHDRMSASDVESGTLYHRHASPQRSDFYTLKVPPGEDVTFALLSEVIDSRLRGSVTVTDLSGGVIASWVGDSSGDLLRQVTIPADVNRVMISVEDVLFRGGSQYGYVLAVDTHRNAQDLEALQQPRHVRCISAEFATPRKLGESDDPVRIELPATIESYFDFATDQDHYLCTLTKGQSIQLSCYSDRLGEPTDTRIVVQRAVSEHRAVSKQRAVSSEQGSEGQENVSWQRVASGDDCQAVTDAAINLNSRDTELSFTAPESGEYRITVADQDSGEFLSKRQRYVLWVGPACTTPLLIAYAPFPHRDVNTSRPFGSHLLPGTASVIRVFALRRGYSGPIVVFVRSLPDGLSCQPVMMASGQSKTDLVLTTSQDALPGVHELEVIGNLVATDAESEVTATAAAVLWERDGQQPIIRTRVTDRLVVAISNQDSAPVTFSPAGSEPIEVAKGAKVTVPLKIERHDGTQNNVILRARNLPPGIKAADLNIAGDQSTAEWTFDVTAGTTLGLHSIWAQAETKVKHSVNPQSLARETAYNEHLKLLRADPTRSTEHAEMDQAIAASNQRLATLKKQVAPRDFTIFAATPTITLMVKPK